MPHPVTHENARAVASVGIGVAVAIAIGRRFDTDSDSDPDTDSDPEIWSKQSIFGTVDCDLQLTLIASSLYRLLTTDIGNGYQTAKSQHIFRDFVDATAHVNIGNQEIQVRFQKRSHNPYLTGAGFAK